MKSRLQDKAGAATRRGTPKRALDAFFHPRAVAVVGATETRDSVGRTLLTNLTTDTFGGNVYPVNHKHASVLGHSAYASVRDLPEPVDLAVIATPASTVPSVIADCCEAGVQAAVVISAGFREVGAEGARLEQQILKQARAGGVRVVGPNCLGLMNPRTGLNATFAASGALPGNVGFLSQSGALCTSILDWSLREKVGFSAFVSMGSMLDVSWGDLIEYLGDDPYTSSIVMYMESIGDAGAFLSAAREVALVKPIIVIKAGRTEAAAKAAASHTGSLAGSDDVLDAAFRRCGVLRVDRIGDLFQMTEALAKQPRPRGPRLTVVSNAGGPAVLATDALIGEGGQLAELAPQTIARLNEVLPPHWSHQNPVDIIGDAGPDRYEKALAIAAEDANTDGLLVILSPQGMTRPSDIAERLKHFAKLPSKPVLASWMGGSQIAAGDAILNDAGIPTFPFPDTAARIFRNMWQYSSNLRSLYETPSYPEQAPDVNLARARDVIEAARAAGRTLLTEVESKEVLAAYSIPVPQTRVATSELDALVAAEDIGYPVVLKLHSHTVTHKSDIGGVHLNLGDADAVHKAYRAIAERGGEDFAGVTVQPMVRSRGFELILGSSVDSQFGPVILFGAGGEFVEIFKDRALALPPLNSTLALRMMERTRIYNALGGARGRKAVDLAALEQLIVRFSQLVVEQPWIKEIDINPLLASAEQIVALDARIILHDPSAAERELPHPAIRPYPTRYIQPLVTRDETRLMIRPIRPEDEPMMVKFHESLSDRTVYSRYFHLMGLSERVAHERLTRICFIDYNREMVLVAERPEQGRIVGVARMSRVRGANEAEVAFVVSDAWQGRGVGTELVARIVEVARVEGLERLVAYSLPENLAMQRLLRGAGFSVEYSAEESSMVAELKL